MYVPGYSQKISYYYYKIPPASSIRNSDAVLTLFLRSEVEITLQLRRHYIVCYTEHHWVHMTLKFGRKWSNSCKAVFSSSVIRCRHL